MNSNSSLNINHLLLVAITLCTVITNGYSQSAFKIEGALVQQSGEGLEYATVSIYSLPDSTLVTGSMTELDGQFSIPINKPGEYSILSEFLGFDPVWTLASLSPSNKQVNVGQIIMVESSQLLETVEITEQKSMLVHKLDKKVYDVSADALSRANSADEILNNLPGINVDLEGGVTLRGNSGVKILVNGVPNAMLQSDNANGLRQLQANQIERIEIITNPSAKYEAAGTGGIINIILKKSNKSGFNGALEAGVTYPWGYNLGANLNYRKSSRNFFISAAHGIRRNFGGGFRYQESIIDDLFTISDQQQMRDRQGINNTITIGVDQNIGKYQTLTLSGNYNWTDEDNIARIEYFDYLMSQSPENLIADELRTDQEVEKENNYSGEIRYQNSFNDSDTEKLTFITRVERNSESEGSDLQTLNRLDNSILVNQRSGNSEGERNILFQTDYEKTYDTKFKLESGLRANLRNVENDYGVEQLNNNVWEPLDPFNGNFIYKENIYAAYTSVGKELDKWSALAGLRYEYSDISTQTSDENKQDYLYGNFFPSAFLTYKASDKNSYQLSYSRRIERPRFWYLNPFFTFSDARNFFSGNPEIQPQYTDSYEVGNLYYFEQGSIASSLYYKRIDGYVERILFNNADGTTTNFPQNIGYATNKGAELTVTYQPIKAFRVNTNWNLFLNSVFPDNTVELNVVENNLTWEGKATIDYRPTKTFSSQLRYNYRGPQETTQGSRQYMQSFDVSLSKDFFNDNMTLTFTGQDIFLGRIRRWEIVRDDFFQRGEFFWRGRVFKLVLSYRINQKKSRKPSRDDYNGGGGDF